MEIKFTKKQEKQLKKMSSEDREWTEKLISAQIFDNCYDIEDVKNLDLEEKRKDSIIWRKELEIL